MLKNWADVTHISLQNVMDKGLMTHLRLDFCGVHMYVNNSCDPDITIIFPHHIIPVK